MGSKGSKNKPTKGTSQKPNKLSEKDFQFFSAQTGLTKPEIKSILEKFNENNPDSKLDRAEFIRLYSTLRPESNDQLDEISHFIFNAFDSDKNGSISFGEFLMAFALTSRGDPRKKLEYAFDLYDSDKSGTLNSSEIREVLVGMLDLLGAQKSTNMQHLTEECISQLDKNNDGSITKSEFIEGLLSNYSLRMLMSPFN